MAKQKQAGLKVRRTVSSGDLKLLQAPLPKDLVIAFRTLAMARETTVRALLQELIRERLKRESHEGF